MYALLLPSAQRFISAVLENVKVELRAIGVVIGAPIPCFSSPLWMARVASPHWSLLLLLIGARFSRETTTAQQPNWRFRRLPEAVSPMFQVSLASGGFRRAAKGRQNVGFFKPLRCCLGSVRCLDLPFMKHLLSFLFHWLAFARGFGCGD